MDWSAVTRIDVVDQNGVHEFWGDRWEIHLQDEGRTLKLFQKDGYGAAAKAMRDVSLARDFQSLGEDVLIDWLEKRAERLRSE